MSAINNILKILLVAIVLHGCDDFVEEVDIVDPTAEESGEIFEPVQFAR